MTIVSRIMGYEITLQKIAKCPSCGKNIDLEILERVIDNDNNNLKYALVLKCHNCFNLFLSIYEAGDENSLARLERLTKQKPLNPIKG